MIEPTSKHIGCKVVYRNGLGQFEDGVITSFNDHYVFVRYGADAHSKATRREDLQWMPHSNGERDG